MPKTTNLQPSTTQTPEELLKIAIRATALEEAFMPSLLGDKRQAISEYFTQLTLLPQEKENTVRRLWEEAQSDVLASENSEAQTLPLEELFNSKDRQLLFGAAGSGKSTFCQYLTWCFALPNSSAFTCIDVWQKQFEMVLFIRLKRIVLEKYQKLHDEHDPVLSIARILYKEVLSEQQHAYLCNVIGDGKKAFEEGSYLIKQWLNKSGTENGRVLLILDGLDEVIRTLTEDNHAGEILRCLFKYPYLLITSRPLNSLDTVTDLGPIDRQLENQGFLPKDIHVYVERYFVKDKAETFLQVL